MDNWRINFCQNLRHLRKVYTMTQEEMAGILGVSVNTLGKIERCEPAVRIHCGMLCRVCGHFRISADELLLENWPEILKR